MRQRCLDDLTPVVGFLRRPVPERRAETVRHAAVAWYWSTLGSVDMEIDLPLRMGNTSLSSPSVRAASRISSARPQSGTRCSRFAFIRAAKIVHTAPAVSISSHLASWTSPEPRRREHQELERQLDGRLRRIRVPHRPDGCGHVLVRQRQPVRHDVALRTKHRQHPVAGIVVSQVHCDRPLQHRPDALAYGAGRLRLHRSDRREDLQHVGRVDLGDGPAADPGEGVPFEAPPPVLRVPLAVPAAALLFEHALSGLGEGRNAPPRGASARAGPRPTPPACGWRGPAREPRPARSCMPGLPVCVMPVRPQPAQVVSQSVIQSRSKL